MKRVSFVTPIGFKPITAGAEIQCAIQLRHGAFFGEWCKSNYKDCATEPFLVSGANPFFKVAPRSLFWRVVQIPFYKVAPRSLLMRQN